MHPINDSGNNTSVPAFLAKLWRLVEDPETNHLIYWNSDGRSFIIQNQAQFAKELLPLNYKHNNMASFIRQLNMYGFHKITSLDNGGLKFDRDDMEFCHPCFLQGHPSMLANIKRKIANARNQPIEEKVVATIAQPPAVKPETLNRVLNEVKVMRGKQEVLDNRFSEMKQENEALWREVVMLRQKHMKQQQIVNKLIQFLVTIVQPSGRGNMGMKRRLPLMLNDAPTSSKTRKTNDYGMQIHSLDDEDYDDDDDEDDYVNLMSLEKPIVLQSKSIVPSSIRGMISEIPNTPSSTRSHHDDLEDIDEIIEEEAQEEDVHKIFEELNEATSTSAEARKDQSKTKKNGKAASSTTTIPIVTSPAAAAIAEADDMDSIDPNEFLKFNNVAGISASGSSSTTANQTEGAAAAKNQTTTAQQPIKTWYANKDGFISAEIPTELFDDQSQSSAAAVPGMQDANMNPTMSEDLTKKIDDEEEEDKKKKKFNGARLELQRLPSNSGDVFSLATPEDFTMHLDNVQSDLITLKGLLATTDPYSFDPNNLTGPGSGSSLPGGSMSFNPNLMTSLEVDSDGLPKMFDDSQVLIPYQLSGDALGLSNDAGASDSAKTEAEKQLLEYNPTLDFSELLDDESSSMVSGRDFLVSTGDNSSSLNTPQPQ